MQIFYCHYIYISFDWSHFNNMRKHFIKIYTFLLCKYIYNKSILIPLFFSILFLQPVNLFILKYSFTYNQLNQIPCLVMYQGIHFLFHAFLPLLSGFYLHCFFISSCQGYPLALLLSLHLVILIPHIVFVAPKSFIANELAKEGNP